MPKLTPRLDDWDNMSSDEESSDSLEGCRSICEGKSTCLQFSFRYQTQTCKTSSTVKLGRKQEQKDGAVTEEPITSGWLVDRIEAWAKDMDTACQGNGWVVT